MKYGWVVYGAFGGAAVGLVIGWRDWKLLGAVFGGVVATRVVLPLMLPT